MPTSDAYSYASRTDKSSGGQFQFSTDLHEGNDTIQVG